MFERFSNSVKYKGNVAKDMQNGKDRKVILEEYGEDAPSSSSRGGIGHTVAEQKGVACEECWPNGPSL